MQWLSCQEGNYLRCYLVWLTTLIAFSKVRLALEVIHKEGKEVCVLAHSWATGCRLLSTPPIASGLAPVTPPLSCRFLHWLHHFQTQTPKKIHKGHCWAVLPILVSTRNQGPRKESLLAMTDSFLPPGLCRGCSFHLKCLFPLLNVSIRGNEWASIQKNCVEHVIYYTKWSFNMNNIKSYIFRFFYSLEVIHSI